jgi:hypothetical protein
MGAGSLPEEVGRGVEGCEDDELEDRDPVDPVWCLGFELASLERDCGVGTLPRCGRR